MTLQSATRRTPTRTAAVTGSAGIAVVAGLLTGSTAGAAPSASPLAQAAATAAAAGTAASRTGVAVAATDGDPIEPVLRSQPVPSRSSAVLSTPSTAGDPRLQIVASQPRERTEPFETVAVTWEDGTTARAMQVQVQVRRQGSWSGWESLEYAEDEGPEASEDSGVRDGTAAWWTGPADGVAVRVLSASGEGPNGVSVVTIDDPTVGTDGALTGTQGAVAPAVATRAGAPVVRPPRFPLQPRVVSRRQWRADERLGDNCFSPLYGRTTKMVFVHHTVGSNRYSRSEAPAIVRSILAYHTQGQGWCDIGYNFLVDRFGTIYEGRSGGVRRPVRGAHAGDYNLNTVGISMMGSFQRQQPSAAMKNALVRLVGWRLGTSYHAPRAKTSVAGSTFRRISGHRDAMATACPGGRAYAWLPTLRGRVADYLRRYSSPLERRADAMGERRTGPVFVGEMRVGAGRRTNFARGSLVGRRATGVHWLTGAPLARYDRTGGANGHLGLPVSDFSVRSRAGVRSMRFQRGQMLVRNGEAHALWGPILGRYRKSGGPSGRFGVPRTSVQWRPWGARAMFAHGIIRYDRSSERVTVSR